MHVRGRARRDTGRPFPYAFPKNEKSQKKSIDRPRP